MKPTEPLPLFHTWPMFEAGRRFDLGWVSGRGDPDPVDFVLRSFDKEALGRHGIGQWVCDLSDDSLTWSNEVYDLFGLPRGVDLSRAKAVAQYCEGSRAAMERLRAYAIRYRRGFTLDAEICAINGERRWMRLIAAPVCVDNKVVQLAGIKHQITD